MLPLHQLACLPEDKSQSYYDFLSFFIKCVWWWGVEGLMIHPTDITSTVELRENKAIPSNMLRNLQNPTLVLKASTIIIPTIQQGTYDKCLLTA